MVPIFKLINELLELPFQCLQGQSQAQELSPCVLSTGLFISFGYSPVYLTMTCCCLQVLIWFFPWPFFPLTEGEDVSIRQECVSFCATSVSMRRSSARRWWSNEILTSWRTSYLSNTPPCALPTLGQIPAGLSLDKGWLCLRRLQSSQTEKL